ncbi:hypothetical protein BN130_1002 [Cronobacter malonaticus 507]|nr:hypothetical protein BN131_720 [Cronobacter malonaticus 681]CCJ96824.1 hypothetical protein BN130_1002 [Cronobacter malonaticus 507]
MAVAERFAAMVGAGPQALSCAAAAETVMVSSFWPSAANAEAAKPPHAVATTTASLQILVLI